MREEKDDDDVDSKEILEIPRGIDHRFFVRGAPKCFRESLFERNDEEDEGDGEC